MLTGPLGLLERTPCDPAQPGYPKLGHNVHVLAPPAGSRETSLPGTSDRSLLLKAVARVCFLAIPTIVEHSGDWKGMY